MKESRTPAAAADGRRDPELRLLGRPRRPRPLFSIIIPTHRRPAQLHRCVAGIAALDFPPDQFEVIIVNDGGAVEDSTEVVQSFRDRLTLRLLDQEHGGPGAARNLGASAATGRYLAFIDDDCAPASGWLRALHAQLASTPKALVGGRIENALPGNRYATASQLITSYTYDYYDRRPEAERFFTTNNLAIATRSFRALGGFDTRIPARTAEDKEFCDRWRASGRELAYAGEAVVHHAHELTFRSFVRQHFNYGRGILCFRLMRWRRPTQRKRLRPEPLAFYVRLIRYPIDVRLDRDRWTAVALLILSQAATLAGALRAVATDVRPLRRALAERADVERAAGLRRHPHVPTA